MNVHLTLLSRICVVWQSLEYDCHAYNGRLTGPMGDSVRCMDPRSYGFYTSLTLLIRFGASDTVHLGRGDTVAHVWTTVKSPSIFGVRGMMTMHQTLNECLHDSLRRSTCSREHPGQTKTLNVPLYVKFHISTNWLWCPQTIWSWVCVPKPCLLSMWTVFWNGSGQCWLSVYDEWMADGAWMWWWWHCGTCAGKQGGCVVEARAPKGRQHPARKEAHLGCH